MAGVEAKVGVFQVVECLLEARKKVGTDQELAAAKSQVAGIEG